MAINAGVNISKLVGYGVLAPIPGVDVTKLVAYVVVGPKGPGDNITKLVAYTVLAEAEANIRPQVIVIT